MFGVPLLVFDAGVEFAGEVGECEAEAVGDAFGDRAGDLEAFADAECKGDGEAAGDKGDIVGGAGGGG